METYLYRDGQRCGPYALSVLKTMYEQGALCSTDLLWDDNSQTWLPVAEIFRPDSLPTEPPPLPPVTSTDYDPSALIVVCESILEDGEVSGAEVYLLAAWLNEHREACLHWPGELLVKPLQEAWSDGKVTKTELRQIARLLLRIRKDWAKRQAEAAFDRATDIVAGIVDSFDLGRPSLPPIPFVARVRSHTDRSAFYEVDLNGPTCTCPDWRSQRCRLPLGHLSRCCKHVFDAYGQLEPEGGWPGWLGAFLDLAYPPHPWKAWLVVPVGRSFVLASTAPTGWADVFANVGGTYDRFGYNVPEDRWAYGVEPTGSGRIRRAIVEDMGG